MRDLHIKKVITIFLSILLIVSLLPTISHGEIVETSHYRLDTGVVFVWKNSAGQWQNGWQPGGSISYSYQHTLPKDAASVDVCRFDPNAGLGGAGYFDFDQRNYYHWNSQAAWDRNSYLDFYYDYAVTSLSVSGGSSYNPDNGGITVNYSMRFSPQGVAAYDVKRELSYGESGKQAIIDLLGNPSQEIISAMNLMDPSSEHYDSNVEGYLYFIPIVFSYTLEEEQEEEEEPVEPVLDITGEAHLNLPEWTYEGHTVEAWDTSLFTVDGEGYSAYRMYQEALANNAFLPAGAAANNRTGLTTADLTFNKIGTFPVTLKVTAKTGADFRDTKNIEVRKTPTIIAALGGVQKENRKQTLNVTIATAPLFPLKTLQIEVSRESTGECVHLFHLVEGSENQLVNSNGIKTRPIQLISWDPYFTQVRLEFLTKNTIEEAFTYKVYCEDARGNWDEITRPFVVAPDLPPQALMELPQEFLRKKGTDSSVINIEDVSSSDGDQLLRTWTVLPLNGNGDLQRPGPQSIEDLPGFKDLSFGTGKKVSFIKEGVGKVDVHLLVKDHWIEETLEEYVLPSDYKEGEAFGETIVENIPPKILIEPLFAKKATILFIATSKVQAQLLSQNENLLRKDLIQREIDGEILIETIPPNITDGATRGYYQGTWAALPFGFNGSNTFLEDKWFSVDEENLYTINGTWDGGTHNDYPKMPYTITSRNGENGEINWTFTVTEDVMQIEPTQGDGFTHDNKGRYLFFRYGETTLIISKDNGSYLAKVPATLGGDNYWSSSGSELLYSIKSDGIYALNTGDGSYRKVYSGQILGKTQGLDGGVHFIEQRSPAVINRGFFDLSNENLSFSRIRSTNQDSVNTTYNCLGIDYEGTVIMGINGSSSIRIYDKSNIYMRSISGWNIERTFSVTPVYDEKGICNYITASWEGKGSTTYWNYTGVWGVNNETNILASMKSTSGFRTDVGYPMFSMQAGNKVHVQTGAMWAGMWGGGSVMNYYTEFAYLCTFDILNGTWDYSSTGDFSFGVAGEYGSMSNSLLAASYTYNEDAVATDPSQGMSGLYAKTMLRNQTMDDVMARILPKHKKDLHIFYVPENPGSEYLQEVSDLVATGEGKYERVVELKATEGEGNLQRSYTLDPNKTYYYEYQVKGLSEGGIIPFTYDFLSQSREDEQELSLDTYKVIHTEKEEFNGGEGNPFFQITEGRTSDGVYKGADLNTGKTKLPNRVFSDGSSITFTVPEGVKALLSFDYNVGGKGWASTRISLNDEPWHVTPGITGGVGGYTSPEFLPEGLNTLTFSTVDYGTLPLGAYAYIDNLSCSYVEGKSEETEPLDPTITYLDDGFVHGKGELKTPPEVMAYRGFPGESVVSNFIDMTDDRIIKNNGNPDAKVLTINIPQSKVGLDTEVLLYSRPSSSSRNSWNVTWTWYPPGHVWTCYGKSENGTVPLQIPGDWRVNLGSIQGAQTINERARAYNGSWGDFGRVSFYQTHRKPDAYAEGAYFYELDDEGNRTTMFIENDTYLGETLFTLKVNGKEPIYLRDFEIYSIEKGVKVYAEEGVHNAGDFLSKWTSHYVEAKPVVIEKAPEKERETLIYKKGELVAYDLFYSDYEEDPSRREYWRYTHTPFNDGVHPDQGRILDRSISRFYIDGKYVVEHWQEDNPSRKDVPKDSQGHPLGYPDFNKFSNVETVTFYIEGTATAPWITDIRTQVKTDGRWKNKVVDYKDNYRIQIRVDDEEKDILSLTTEVYLDKKLIGAFLEENIKAGRGGSYPEIWTPPLPDLAAVGRYQVVCTVRDETGTGLGTYRFEVDRIQPNIRIHRLF